MVQKWVQAKDREKDLAMVPEKVHVMVLVMGPEMDQVMDTEKVLG